MRCCRWGIFQILGPKSAKYGKMDQIKVSEGLKSWYRQLWAEFSIKDPKLPIMLVYPVIYLLYAIWGIIDEPFLKIWVLRVWKYHKMAKIKVSEGLKSQYRKLWAEYFIRNPKTPYNVSIPGYLILICHSSSCSWTISQIGC